MQVVFIQKVSQFISYFHQLSQASLNHCVDKIWAYLRKNNLQDPQDKEYFIPDASYEKMAKVFGTEKIRVFGSFKYLFPHLTDLQNQF